MIRNLKRGKPGTLLVVPLLLAVASMATAQAARAATWTVDADPGDPERRIEAAVGQAASGDTILVGPGLYYEHIPVPPIDLTIIGRDGAQATILDGERAFPDHEGSIIYGPGGLRLLRLEGLTFQHGQGSTWEAMGRVGGAVNCESRSLEVSDCRFIDNQAMQVAMWGGAVGVNFSPMTTIRRCQFVNNNCTRDGGTLYAGFCGDLTISDSRFEGPEHLRSNAVYVYGGGTGTIGKVTIERCDIVSGAGRAGMVFQFMLVDLIVRESRFLDSSGESALASGGDLDGDIDLTMKLERNVFWRDPAIGGPDNIFSVESGGGRVHLQATGNTFSGMDLYANAHDVLIEGNIFSASVCRVSTGVGDVRCNCSWPDSIQILYAPQLSMTDNLIANPLLCNEASGDLHIASQSPCAPDHSPAGCGLIGALGVGCESTPVLNTSWGQIKYLIGGMNVRLSAPADRGERSP